MSAGQKKLITISLQLIFLTWRFLASHGLLEAPKNILGVVDFFLSKSMTCELVLYMCVCVRARVCIWEAGIVFSGIGVVAMDIYIYRNIKWYFKILWL